MYKTTVRAQGFFDDEPKSYTLYFNLSRREMLNFAKEYEGVDNFREHLDKLQKSEDNLALVEFIDNLIGTAYGEREGERFIKSDIIKQNFIDGPLYEVIFNKMVEDPKFAMNLMTGLMPASIADQVKDEKEYKALERQIEEQS